MLRRTLADPDLPRERFLRRVRPVHGARFRLPGAGPTASAGSWARPAGPLLACEHGDDQGDP
jgi:hypothetical protein